MKQSDPVPIQSPQEPVQILQISDSHLLEKHDDTLMGVNTEESFRQVIALAQQHHWPPDLILFTGDLAQQACRAVYLRLRRSLESLAVPCYCLPGNHDDSALMAELLNRQTVRTQAQILLQDWQIICLDSRIPEQPGGYLAEGELKRLDALLSAQPEKHALIALHHHPIPIGSGWMDTMVLENAKQFFAVLGGHHQVRAILCGHIHQVFEGQYKGFKILGAPSTCFQFKPYSEQFRLDHQPPGYRWLKLYGNGTIETAVIRLQEVSPGLDETATGY